MADETRVTIVAWPEEPARLEHRLDMEKPCQVSISFAETPANVVISTRPEQPLHVAMDMNVVVREQIPLCIKVCEPICAQSDYSVGIAVFDNPVATIGVRGQTRFFNCGREPPETPTCVDFNNLQVGTEFPQQFSHGGLTFTPLDEPLRAAGFGDPVGQVKLAFPPSGVRIDFPAPANDVRITVNNYAGPTIDFAVFSGSTLVNQFSEPIPNTVRQITIPQPNITAVEIKGGRNEACVVEVCYTPTQSPPSIIKLG